MTDSPDNPDAENPPAPQTPAPEAQAPETPPPAAEPAPAAEPTPAAEPAPAPSGDGGMGELQAWIPQIKQFVKDLEHAIDNPDFSQGSPSVDTAQLRDIAEKMEDFASKLGQVAGFVRTAAIRFGSPEFVRQFGSIKAVVEAVNKEEIQELARFMDRNFVGSLDHERGAIVSGRYVGAIPRIKDALEALIESLEDSEKLLADPAKIRQLQEMAAKTLEEAQNDSEGGAFGKMETVSSDKLSGQGAFGEGEIPTGVVTGPNPATQHPSNPNVQETYNPYSKGGPAAPAGAAQAVPNPANFIMPEWVTAYETLSKEIKGLTGTVNDLIAVLEDTPEDARDAAFTAKLELLKQVHVRLSKHLGGES